MHCPAKQGLIGVANNYVHCWRVFTSQLWLHNCVIIFESASATVVFTNWSTRGSSVIPLRITWLTNMFTYFAGRCFAYARRHDLGTCTCFVQTCIITAVKGEPLTLIWMNQYVMKRRCPSLMVDKVKLHSTVSFTVGNSVELHSLLIFIIYCLWNCDSEICKWDPYCKVRMNFQVWFQLFVAFLFQAHRRIE
jgi:hypothetical protein